MTQKLMTKSGLAAGPALQRGPRGQISSKLLMHTTRYRGQPMTLANMRANDL